MALRAWRLLRGDSLWRDLLLAATVATGAALLAAQVNLSEQVFGYTRGWERYQLDEWPTAVLVFAVLMVALYARRHAQLRRALGEKRYLVGRLLEVQEDERRRLARELHDELGQTLNAIQLDAAGLPESPTARRIAANTDQVYRAAAALVRNLRPPALDELGLVSSLEACVERWRESCPGLAVHFAAGGQLHDLGEAVNIAVYRTVQEALTNCVRHGRANNFYIDLTRSPEDAGCVLLEMHDDGVGMPAGMPAGGGLAGMQERATLLGGCFQLLSQPGQGVTIHVELPARGMLDD